ncbi:MAG TPA: DUF4384 domain-containing protein [Gemmatimonadales bacterium]|nr:DUF4384 domain-containing protein [Gemmatimonadales bacterium]
MFSALVLSLLSAPLAAPAVAQDDPPIRISLNNDRRFEQGDRGHVKVRVEDDGFLVVLHADPDGRVRMLFPLDPDDDNYVRGDRTYEIRGRGDRESFTVDYESGEGAIYAAVSRDPFRFDQFVVNRHWDYEAFNAQRLPEQPEPELTALVQRMASSRFEYDYLTYNVYERGYDDVVYAPSVIHRTYYDDPYCAGYYFSYRCDPYYYGRNRFSVSISFGRPYYYGGYYRPVYYDPFYDPWYYGYGHGYYTHPYYPRYTRPVYVYPGRPYGVSPYRPRYVNQTTFKQDNRTWDGESYRVRSTNLSDIRAVNTVYGDLPARRVVSEGDGGKSPVLQPSPSRDVDASPSRRPVDRKPTTTTMPEGRRSPQAAETSKRSNEKAADAAEPARRERQPEAVRARPERDEAAPRRVGSGDDRNESVRSSREPVVPNRAAPERSRPDAERARPETQRARPEAERSRPEPARASPRRDESSRAESSRPSQSEPERSSPRPSVDRAPAPSRPSVDRAPAPSRPSYSAPRQSSPSRSAPSGGSGGGRRRTN